MTTTIKGSTIFRAVYTGVLKQGGRQMASFFTYDAMKEYVNEQIAKGKRGWLSDPTFVHTTEHGYKDRR